MAKIEIPIPLVNKKIVIRDDRELPVPGIYTSIISALRPQEMPFFPNTPEGHLFQFIHQNSSKDYTLKTLSRAKKTELALLYSEFVKSTLSDKYNSDLFTYLPLLFNPLDRSAICEHLTKDQGSWLAQEIQEFIENIQTDCNQLLPENAANVSRLISNIYQAAYYKLQMSVSKLK